MVLLMTVNPGFGGQSSSRRVPKIRALPAEIERRGLDVDIEVDGGIVPATARTVVAAGANVLVAGSAVFERPVETTPGDRGAARGRTSAEVATCDLERGAWTDAYCSRLAWSFARCFVARRLHDYGHAPSSRLALAQNPQRQP